MLICTQFRTQEFLALKKPLTIYYFYSKLFFLSRYEIIIREIYKLITETSNIRILLKKIT
jgi:hypothetical protein